MTVEETRPKQNNMGVFCVRCFLNKLPMCVSLCTFKVRDFDKFSRHTVLGEVRVPVGQLNISYPLELQENLQTPQKVQ